MNDSGFKNDAELFAFAPGLCRPGAHNPMDFPVYYAGIRPLDSMGRARVMAYDVPSRCGDVLVQPGELSFADFDGIVVGPRAVETQVLSLAGEKAGKESASRADILAGKSLREVYETYRVL